MTVIADSNLVYALYSAKDSLHHGYRGTPEYHADRDLRPTRQSRTVTVFHIFA